MTTPNRDLLLKTLDHIEHLHALQAEHPSLREQWNQGHWIGPAYDDQGDLCGTAGCFAGWASVLATGGHVELGHGECDICDDNNCIACARLVLPDGAMIEPDEIRRHATRALGLDEMQAVLLFEGGNTVEQLREIVEEIVGD